MGEVIRPTVDPDQEREDAAWLVFLREARAWYERRNPDQAPWADLNRTERRTVLNQYRHSST